MAFLVAAILLSVSIAAHAQPTRTAISANDNPEAYWNRGFSCSQTADNYSLTLRVNEVDPVASKVDAVMTAAGAPSQIGTNYNAYFGGGGQQRGRQLNYSVPMKAADKLAKKLMEMGELMNYSMNRQNSGDALAQIEERIVVLEAELANVGSLAKMPSAAYFLRTRLNGLKQNRDVCLAGASRSSISVSLQLKPAEAKP